MNMKNFCIISIICILIGCNNAVDKKITYNDPLQISVKKGENMSIGDEQYYYATMNGDTLNLFCEFYVIPQMHIMRINFVSQNYKISMSDTAIVSTCSDDDMYKKTTYNQQMFLVDEYIRLIAGEFDIQKLTSIDFPLLTSGTLNIEISNLLVNHKINRMNIIKAVEKSSIYANINNILKKYKLEIKDVGGIEKVAFADKQSFMDENVTDSLPTLNKNDMFVQGYVYFEIGPI